MIKITVVMMIRGAICTWLKLRIPTDDELAKNRSTEASTKIIETHNGNTNIKNVCSRQPTDDDVTAMPKRRRINIITGTSQVYNILIIAKARK
jgi:hypothetical protein